MKSGFWPFSINPYELLLLIKKNPRIKEHEMAKKFHVNDKTAANWWNAALVKEIILLPEFRKKAFQNFLEYFYFLNVEDPHEMFEELVENQAQIKDDIMHFSVQTGFCNFQIVSNKKINLKGKIVLSGVRSDYFVTTPSNCTFSDSITSIKNKLTSIREIEVQPTPLIYYDSVYENWSETDEKIYLELSENLRKPFKVVLEKTGAKRDEILDWMKRRNQFGHTIVMYFPNGLRSYQPTIYCIDTSCDSLLIDIFSALPVPTVFYRIGGKLMMKVYLENDSLEGKYISNKVLSTLRKKELAKSYANSTIQYGYRT